MSGKLADIIRSGKAPGVTISGQQAVDPNSVYAKAPRGLAAIENEPKWKNGPTRSAKDISRYMGMPTDFIRKTWSKPVLVALLCFCWASYAGDIQPGTSLTDGQLVHASDLNNLVGNATINNSFISGKSPDPTPLGSDKWIIYSPTLNGMYSLTLNAGVLQNSALITAQSEKVTPVAGDYLLMWDSVGMNLAKVSAGNLTLNNTNLISGQPFMQASNLDPQLHVPILNYGTNAQSTGSNIFSALVPNTVTNWPTITAATNTDLVPVYSTRTGGAQTNTMTLISPQALGPSTYVITNISMTNFISLGFNNGCLSTNIPSVIPPEFEAFAVVTNTIIDGSGHTLYSIGTEIPARQILNASNLPAINAYWLSFNSNVFVSTCFSTNSLLSVPWLVGTNDNRYETASWTNFNIKLYITPRHGL